MKIQIYRFNFMFAYSHYIIITAICADASVQYKLVTFKIRSYADVRRRYRSTEGKLRLPLRKKKEHFICLKTSCFCMTRINDRCRAKF